MKSDYIDITLVLDKSGSMLNVANETIQGVNSFVDGQAAELGKCVFSLYTFDTIPHAPMVGLPIKSVKPLTSKTYVPSGFTALHDTIAKAIKETGERLAAMPEEERPGKVLFAIITDGEENHSVEYKDSSGLRAIAEMIKH